MPPIVAAVTGSVLVNDTLTVSPALARVVVVLFDDSGPITTEGAVVSMVKGKAVEASPVLPATSVAVAVMLREPSVNAVVGVKLQAPSAAATVVPKRFVPSLSVTVEPASAVPLKVGKVSLLRPVAGIVPVTAPTLSEAPKEEGARGAVVSMVTDWLATELTLPAASVAVTLSV